MFKQMSKTESYSLLLNVFIFFYLRLLNLSPLKFHRVDRCRSRTRDCCSLCIDRQTCYYFTKLRNMLFSCLDSDIWYLGGDSVYAMSHSALTQCMQRRTMRRGLCIFLQEFYTLRADSELGNSLSHLGIKIEKIENPIFYALLLEWVYRISTSSSAELVKCI